MLPTNNNTLERITANANEYGIAPGPLEILRKEKTIAEETIEVTGLYISWLPNSYCQLTSSCADEIRSRTGQCARVGRSSSCLCGHPLSNHEEVNYNRNSKSLSYIKPPKCSRCSCKVFNYCPSRPEEVGQYWLPRRKDFDIKIWRQRVRQVPHDYCCIGCEQRVSEHETVFETAAMRRERGASVGMDYIPLQQHSEMQHLVFKKSNNDSMRNSSQFVRRISNDNNNSTAGLSNRTNNVIIHDGNHRMYDSNERVLSISNTSTSTNMKPSSSNTVVTSNDIVVGKRSQVRYSPLSDK